MSGGYNPNAAMWVKDRNDLIDKYNKLGDPGKLKIFSAWTIIKQVSVGIAALVLIALLLKFLLF